jgi:hypothetical protein
LPVRTPGEEAICLGKAKNGKKWGFSPYSNDQILSLEHETYFGLLIDLSGDSKENLFKSRLLVAFTSTSRSTPACQENEPADLSV